MTDSIRELLKVRERLDHNLSGSQIVSVMDALLNEAMIPLILHTKFFNMVLVRLIPRVFANSRRKHSNLPREEFIDVLFSMIVVRDPRSCIALLKMARLERTILFSALDLFFEATADYQELYGKRMNTTDPVEHSQLTAQIVRIERQVRADHDQLFAVLHNARHCYGLAHNFKGMIIEKYIRLAHNEAKKAAANTKLNIDVKELFKNLILSISKAIDKYDPEKGALTTYVKWWFMDGITQSAQAHEYGVAYYIPTSQRRRVLADSGAINFAESLDDCLNVEDPSIIDTSILLETEQEERTQCHIYRRTDRRGFAMLALRLHYSLSDEEKQMLIATRHKVVN